MDDLDDKISRIMAGDFSGQRSGKSQRLDDVSIQPSPSHHSFQPSPSRQAIPSNVSVRLKSNSDDEYEDVEHTTYEDVYKSLSEPVIPPSPVRTIRGGDSVKFKLQQDPRAQELQALQQQQEEERAQALRLLQQQQQQEEERAQALRLLQQQQRQVLKKQQEENEERNDRNPETVDPFQQTVNLQLPQPTAVQLFLPSDLNPSPVGYNQDDGQDISFLGVVEHNGDIPYELGVSDAQDTLTLDDLTATNEPARNFSSGLGTNTIEDLQEVEPAMSITMPSPASTPQISSSPSTRKSRGSYRNSSIYSSPSTPSRLPYTSRLPVTSVSRSSSNVRSSSMGTPKRSTSGAPSTPSRTRGRQSSSNMNTPVRGNDRSRAASPDGTVGPNVLDRMIRFALRVRPMNTAETSQRARRTISISGNDIVVVNPRSFDAEPDTIAAAAIAVNNSQWAHAFNFDDYLWSYDIPSHTETIFDQPTVHEHLGLELVENVLNGVNVSCFVYGHAGSGKTFTMFGEAEPSQELMRTHSQANNSSNKRLNSQSARKMQISSSALQLTEYSGLVPRVFHDIVRTVKENQVSIRESRIFFSCYLIYNDMVVDLLVDPPMEPPREDQQDNLDALRVREHPVYGPYVESVKRVEIFSVDEVFSLIAESSINRALIQNAWPLAGSRYHTIASLDLTSADLNEILRVDPNRRVLLDNTQTNVQQAIAQSLHLTSAANNTGSNNTLPFRIDGDQFRHDSSGRVIKIQMVDLAGPESEISEASSKEDNVWSGSLHDTPSRRVKNVIDRDKKELRSIRQSLTTLGFVIQSLAKGASTKSLPYRDSTLTFLLRDALNGFQHTTMIGTVTSAHTQFEETLSTLRYLEKFSLSMLNRRRVASGSQPPTTPLSSSINKAFKEPRAILIENFRKFHSNLDLHHKGSVVQRQLLKETITDPQQRIAKLTRGSTEPSVSIYSNSLAPAGATPSKQHQGASNLPVNLTFTSPIDGSLRHLRDITAEDLEHLQSSYRDLQSRVLELQIDFDAVRTDRDTLMVELRATRERLRELEDDRDQAQNKTQNVSKTLKNYEKEVIELRSQLRRREEENDRLMSDLTEQKQARLGSEQAYHSRTKEFLQRFDSVTKEKKALQAALELASHKDTIFSSEKGDMMGQISKLKSELDQRVRTIEEQTIEIRDLRQDFQATKQVADMKEVIEQQKFDVERDRNDLLLKLDALVQDHQGLLTERDSLLAMIKQKDSLMWLQSQQSEASIKILQQRQVVLERAGTEQSSSSGDFQKLLDSLRELFQREGQVFTSANGQAALDTSTLIALIRELKEKIILFDKIEQEFHSLEGRYQTEVTLRQQSDDKFYELSRSLQSAETSNAELSKQLVEVHRELEAMKRMNKGGNGLPPGSPLLNHTSASSYNLHRTSSTSSILAGHAAELSELHLVIKQLNEKIEVQVQENQRLANSLQTAQKEAQQAKDEVAATQNTMQGEFTTLWVSVQELNKLDALKDKSIQELIQERTQLSLERDTAIERLRATMNDCDTLREELEEVDRNLQKVVGMDYHTLINQGLHATTSSPASQSAAVLNPSPPRPVYFLQTTSSQHAQQHQPLNSHVPATTVNSVGGMPTPATTVVPVMMVPPQSFAQIIPPSPLPAPPTIPAHQQYAAEYDPGNVQGNMRYAQQVPSSGRKHGSRQARYDSALEGDDDGLREEILIHQIEELTGFLYDEDRLKRVRLSKNTSSPPATHSSSFYPYLQQQSMQMTNSLPTGGLISPQPSSQTHQRTQTRDNSAQRSRSNPQSAPRTTTPSKQRRFQ